jgi:hypothetical protein
MTMETIIEMRVPEAGGARAVQLVAWYNMPITACVHLDLVVVIVEPPPFIHVYNVRTPTRVSNSFFFFFFFFFLLQITSLLSFLPLLLALLVIMEFGVFLFVPRDLER